METINGKAGRGKLFWIGWVLSILPVLMLLFSATGKFLKPDGIEEGVKAIGWRMDQLTGLGIVELSSTILYLIPKTAVLGAILLTAYMGGAVATHVRVSEPFYFQVLLGVLIWLGLWLRDARLRDLLPLRN
ncbi:MAG: DoxX family protein [Acidobacteria bacterium]|nr:DoxX family protein [Acidobacteriota bacterium]